ncbi:MAG: M61 family metallopeptidase [Burkholderiales bacterium]|nr:M61 family metallopeptidase [Burkholderiales bacterium]
MINYQITPLINSHIYTVVMQFRACAPRHVLRLPSWIPGSYMIREFSKNIINIQVDPSTNCYQSSKDCWDLHNLKSGELVNVIYQVYANELGIRTAFLDFNRGYFNSSSLCLYVEGLENVLHNIEFSQLPKDWNIATGLLKVGEGKYQAQNYMELIDCPIELGIFTQLGFIINKKQYYLILSGNLIQNFDQKRLIADMSKICQTQIDLFGGIAPFNEYTFILYLQGEVYTGLEHRNSTLLIAPYYSLPVLHESKLSEAYLKLLSLISHEFFHTWNIKRIKPQAFNPYNLNQENYTKLLWWFEGITSYYDDLVLRKALLIDDKRYLNLITKNINDVYKFSGVEQQTLANSSLTAWIKYYRQDENSPNVLVSYYTKGALVGMCLDLLIRNQTNSQKSLDDVMYNLYQKWLRDGLGIGENEIPHLIKQYTGCDLSREIEHFVETCDELPLLDLLSGFGVRIHRLAHRRYEEVGRVIDKISDLPKLEFLDIGCKLTKDTIGYKINYVYTGSVAQSAGLSANDILIAIDNIKLTDFNKQISLYKLGDSIKLSIFRGETLFNLKIKLKKSQSNVIYLEIINSKKLSGWL